MTKSDLQARPIFHQTRGRIEAHLTVCFAALGICRYVQNKTKDLLDDYLDYVQQLLRLQGKSILPNLK
jgi:hypothetical protein